MENRQNRRDARNWLQDKLGYKARKVQDLNQLSFEEKGLICQLTWQSWENLLWTLCSGSEEHLQKVVSKPQLWKDQLPSTTCVFSDAIPVYLGVVGGKVMVKKEVHDEKMLRQKRKGCLSNGHSSC